MVHARLIFIVAILAGMVTSSCATRGPGEEALRRRKSEAGKICGQQYPNVDYYFDRSTGKLMLNVKLRDYPRLSAEQSAFLACMDAELKRGTPGSAGRLSKTAPSHAIVHVDVENGALLAPVTINDTFRGRLIVDTGASLTLLTSDAVRALGITIPPNAPYVTLQLADGRHLDRQVIRIASLRVGEMVVEDLEVVVTERRFRADGLLGQNFLRHFRVVLEPDQRRVVLETRPVAPPPAVTGKPTRMWAAPVSAWSVGDTWRYEWRAPGGQGTSVRHVLAEEMIDGVRHFVVDEGGRRLAVRADSAAVSSERTVGGRLIARYTPPVGYPWPLQVGATWDVDTERVADGGQPGPRISLKCAATEEVTLTVPAGTFETLHVTCQNRAGSVVETWWAAEPRTWIREFRRVEGGDRIEELGSYTVK
jgi:clan AA aspartic protease (TIGR02281 family)